MVNKQLQSTAAVCNPTLLFVKNNDIKNASVP